MSGPGGITLRILGIPVTIGISILIGLLGLGFLSRLEGAFLAEWVVLGFVALLLHELGHALAFRHFGVESTITFWLLGGFTIPTDQEAARLLSDRQMLVVSISGPLVGLILGGAALAVSPAFQDASRSIRVPIFLWTFVNLVWAIFNLLPIASLDGGQALVHLAGAVFGRAGRVLGLITCLAASVLIGVGAFLVGLVSLAFVAIVFGLANPAVYRMLQDEFESNRPAQIRSDSRLPGPREHVIDKE